MSRRLFASFSKYRNAVGKAAKHEDAYTDLKPSTSASTDSCQLVKVSHSWIAFKQINGSIGILPVGTVGRIPQDFHLLSAHGSGVSEWEFSPFDANCLITGAENGEIKVWRIISRDDSVSTELVLTINTGTGKGVESIVHHPTSSEIFASASGNLVQIWDISGKAQGTSLTSPAYTLTHPNTVSSVSWKADGALLATTCKDTRIRVFDPRKQETSVQDGVGHAGNRSSRVIWLGEKDLLATVGFNKMREREVAVWNAGDLSKSLDMKRMDSSSGLTLPLYDEDTSILFIPSRGESIIRWIEISDSAPFMTEGAAFSAQGSVNGAALVPKQLMNVMQTEIVRILTVTPTSLWPVSVNIPRKSYLDFHADIFPDTKSTTPGSTASEWLCGNNGVVPRVSLDPGMAGKPIWMQNGISDRPVPSKFVSSATTVAPIPKVVSQPSTIPSVLAPAPVPDSTATTVPVAAAPAAEPKSVSTPTAVTTAKEPTTEASVTQDKTNPRTANPSTASPAVTTPTTSKAPTATATSATPVAPSLSKPSSATTSPLVSRLATQRSSKFRFLSFKPYHTSSHFENIQGLSISTTPECNLIEVNSKFLALPLHGTGGRVGILKISEPGRVGAAVPYLVCSSDLSGFKFDPFNPNLLVTASDDTKIKGWILPDDGLDKENPVTKPNWTLGAPTMEKISLVLFHPRAKDVLLSASMDRDDPTIRLWDLKAQKEKLAIKGHKATIFSCAFNHDGTKIVSVCKDKKVRVWSATTGELLQEGPNHDSLRSCRVLWLGDSDVIASVGFGRGSQREILLFDANDLKRGSIDSKKMDTSPGILVPHYDADTSVLGVSARGDRVMRHFEIVLENKDHLGPGKTMFVDVASLEQGSLQQDVAYLPKKYCDVREVELAKMYRLTYNSVEVIRVSVPRQKKELFQDDLFPDTIDMETPSIDADEFFSGTGLAVAPQKISLRPADMESLTQHSSLTPVTPQQGGNSLDKFLLGKQQVAEDERKRLAMERMFESAKESKADRDTLVPDTGIIDDDEWDD
ncbi:coronin-7 [Entomortierella parvispora]|uniref:Coronin n=1 Tax=Entomortierella parvispora TaxID=205924 RepID=A0A9P3HM17_9FUNG|nr:coronin-7 [Entomortierella parvispora]